MDVSLIKIDFQDITNVVKNAIQNVDKKLMLALGCSLGLYTTYQALEYVSTSGKTDNRLMKTEEMEGCPDVWFLLKLRDKWYKSCDVVAKAFGANPDNLVFVHNVTEAINCVVKSLNLTANDAVLITNHTYGAVRNIVDYYTKKAGAEMVCCDIPFPINSEDDVCNIYKETLVKNPNIKLVIIDHITSGSALLMPVEKLVNICKEHGKLTLIDGAHAPGQLPLEIENIGADFYAGNLHKWHFAPRGCAFLWVQSAHQLQMDPSLVSHYYMMGYKDKFFRQGTDDLTNYLAGGYAVSEYLPSIGGMEHIYQTNIPMRQWASELFRQTWKTESPKIPCTMQAPFMAVVKMPDAIMNHFGRTQNGANKCKQYLMEKYKAVMMISGLNGALYARVSAQICSTKAEYYRVAKAVKDLAESL
eukprot:gene6329-7055_t